MNQSKLIWSLKFAFEIKRISFVDYLRKMKKIQPTSFEITKRLIDWTYLDMPLKKQ